MEISRCFVYTFSLWLVLYNVATVCTYMIMINSTWNEVGDLLFRFLILDLITAPITMTHTNTTTKNPLQKKLVKYLTCVYMHAAYMCSYSYYN